MTNPPLWLAVALILFAVSRVFSADIPPAGLKIDKKWRLLITGIAAATGTVLFAHFGQGMAWGISAVQAALALATTWGVDLGIPESGTVPTIASILKIMAQSPNVTLSEGEDDPVVTTASVPPSPTSRRA